MKGTFISGKESISIRKILVVSQFTFSIFLVVGTIVVYQQMEYASERQIGYNPQNLITVANNEGLIQNYNALKTELLATGAVVSTVKSNSPITEIYEANFLELAPEQEVNINNIYTEYGYCQTMGIKLIAGRDFSENIKTDTGAVILNKTAVDLIGDSTLIGKKVKVAGHLFELIGISEDVVMDSPYEPVEPLYMVLETEWNRQTSHQNITIRLAETSDLTSALKKVEATFKKINPLYPFEYTFVDEVFNKKFETISLIRNLVNIFAFVAISIACLGLLGLAAFTAERRTKEFGIRKVLGASTSNLIKLISSDFIRLILLSFLISAPITWYLLSNFLERYTYHIDLNWLILPISFLAILLITLFIVGTQAIKVANSNPVESLRSE